MASFQLHRDTHDKENPVMPAALKEKSSVLGVKQPLAILGAKEKAPRANFAVLNGNKGNAQRGVPAGKVVFRDIGNVAADENPVGYCGAKKSNVVPVVEQFKSFSVYEDNNETRTTLALQPRDGKPLANAAEKENQNLCGGFNAKINHESMHKEFTIQQDYDLDATPMSVPDVLSPMSVDRSLVEYSNSSGAPFTDDSVAQDIAESKAATGKDLMKELPPRNDRQRFFEVVQYQLDILQNFRESEKKHRPKPQYMRRQSDINHSMRTILVDWLVEVSEEYNLDTETLYLSVSYIDRFLSQMSVVRSKLQLVGTAAMYIASKYEEIYPPDVGEFVFITDDTYTKSQVLRMEQIILKILSFDLCTPTPYVFVNTYAVLCDMPEQLKYLTLYICELSLLDADPYLHFLPSLVSAAALALSRHILGLEIWSTELEEFTTYKFTDLKDVLLHLSKTHKAAKELGTQAIREKYNKDKYKKASSIDGIDLSETDFNELWQAYNASMLTKQQKQQQDINSNAKVNLFYKF